MPENEDDKLMFWLCLAVVLFYLGIWAAAYFLIN